MDDIGQPQVIAFLNQPGNLGGSEPPEMIETHISRIFLAGERAFKLKRAVKLPYVDFSTPELRLSYCLREVELNSRTAADLYLGVRRITIEPDGSLVFDGEGELLDAVVEMRRFDQSCLFDRLAEEGQLTSRLMEETAQMIAAFHSRAEIVHQGSGSANMAGVLDINERGFATSQVFSTREIDDLSGKFRSVWETWRPVLDRRERLGKIRLCHGDLHLRNIYLAEDGPRLFDCIDFNDQIATVDVLYDLAFLVMDLWHRGLREGGNIVLNRYLDITGDDEDYALVAFFMAVRAAVRAHVTATQAQTANDSAEALKASARSYFELAATLLEPSSPMLIVIGGFSGSGKSTIADALASRFGKAPGARIIESDRIRKAMFGMPAHRRLPEKAYAGAVSEEVYRRICRKAEAVLVSGGKVIADAVFDRLENREEIETVAAKFGVPFVGLWLDADPGTLKSRVEGRAAGPSDATVDVLERQLCCDPGPMGWTRIDTARPLEDVLRDIGRIVGH